MTVDRRRILAELPLPLGPDAGELDAIRMAIALEDACGVTLPEDAIDVVHLGRSEAIESLLCTLAGGERCAAS
ncbi:hypothetical protein [Pseudactinotalea sp. HY158]|uniref:hypothetical protein n=1 Tax=Pseudactinotalea sp. HY158 TaxID=2654547 RepID=UPI00129C9B97|nr:hypothetical protein [Pseudactinotalea sp. HY158]QGH68501.1 hypothetical protein GCE65_02495 [Pseudactinotalea sp. HY158]